MRSGHKGTLSRDHEGNLYPSLSAMARRWNTAPNLVWRRLEAGWSVKDALTQPSLPRAKRRRPRPRRDHLGREYVSQREMCRAWGICYRTFTGRIKRGMTLQQALTAPAARVGRHCQKGDDHEHAV